MCGILASVNCNIHDDDFEKALDFINHRGPNGKNFSRINRVLLGHTRLSIIDVVERSSQPFSRNDIGVHITFNGEIYNYIELRNKLISDGLEFLSESDTEVLLLWIHRYGLKGLKHVDGMYAFVYFDTQKNFLISARDPFGEKPLYYYEYQDKFIFASECSAINSLRGIAKISEIALDEYISYGSFKCNSSPFEDIKQIGPGCAISVNLDNPQNVRKEDLGLLFHENNRNKDDWKRVFEKSVEHRLRSDVPIAILLSGGIDSTLTALIAAKFRSDVTLYTFDFGDNDDEIINSKLVAKKTGLKHRIVKLDITSSDVKGCIDNLDIPVSDPSLIPTFIITKKIAKDGFKVILGGDGGDELFGGYPYYDRLETINKYKWFLPKFPTEFIRNPKWLRIISSINRLKSSQIPYYRIDSSESNTYYSHMSENISLKKQLMLGDIFRFLIPFVLVKNDRVSMLNGVEMRSPFLNIDLFQYIFSLDELPESKTLLVQWIQELLPEYQTFTKRGFSSHRKEYFQKLENFFHDYQTRNLQVLIRSPRDFSNLVYRIWAQRF